MQKVIRDGKVAVLYSPGFGSGFYSWNVIRPRAEEAVFDPNLVELVELREHLELFVNKYRENKQTNSISTTISDVESEIVNYCKDAYPEFYGGGLEQLEVAWLPIGCKFSIGEYDGHEYIITEDDLGLEA